MRGDRISKLPDELIHHIFSFLPSKLTVQTSILSTRWRSLWASSPHLRFDTRDFSSPEKLTPFVEAMLLFRDKSAEIKTFRLCAGHETMEAHIRNWVLYALQYNIEELDLAVFLVIREDDAKLSRRIFTCESLTVLRLTGVIFKSITNAVLGKLTTLHLSDVDFEGSSLSKLVGGCPNLENLLLESCMFDELHASDCKRLKTLSLNVYEIHPKIQIRAPCLSSLKLGIDGLYFMPKEIPCVFSDILEGFCQIEALELRGYTIELIYKEIESSRVLPIFRNLKQLKMDAFLGDGHHILAIISLLNSSPELEDLVINDTKQLFRRKPKKLRDIKSELSIAHLKSIKVDGFQSDGTANKFLTFLLSNAEVLKRMVIIPCQPVR